jgi:hypothetical protein
MAEAMKIPRHNAALIVFFELLMVLLFLHTKQKIIDKMSKEGKQALFCVVELLNAFFAGKQRFLGKFGQFGGF